MLKMTLNRSMYTSKDFIVAEIGRFPVYPRNNSMESLSRMILETFGAAVMATTTICKTWP